MLRDVWDMAKTWEKIGLVLMAGLMVAELVAVNCGWLDRWVLP